MSPNRRNVVALLVAVLLLPAILRAEDPSGSDRTDVAKAFRTLEQALAARDLDAVLAAYDPSDAALVTRIRNEAQGCFTLESVRVEYRVAAVHGAADSPEAVVLRKVTFQEHGRARIMAQWETVRLRRADTGLRIAFEEERDAARSTNVDLRIAVSPERGTLRGTAIEHGEILADGEDALLFVLNRGLEVKSIVDAGGHAVPFDRTADVIVVSQPAPAKAKDTFAFTIEFEGKLFNESEELSYSQVAIAPGGSFASWVTNWYPRVAGAGSKSKGKIVYDVPAGVTVASSGRPVERKTVGDREEQSYTVDRPLDFSFAAAKYFHREQKSGGIPLGVYLLNGGDAKADLYIEKCARVLDVQQAIFGPYPFDGYAVVEIPSDSTGDLGGSSEQGMNLFPTGVLPSDEFPLMLLAHEIGHSWWGNLVASNDGALLSEGLAQTAAVMCVREIDGERAARRQLERGVPIYSQSAAQYFERFGSGAEKDYALGVDVPGSQASGALHDLADTKGFFVFDMIRTKIGQEAFVRGLRAAATDFAGKRIKLSDLRAAWEKAAKVDLGKFFDQWFLRTGAPELVLTSQVEPAGKGFVVTGKIDQVGDLYDVDVKIALASRGRREVRTVAASARSTPFSFPVDFQPELVVLDPEYEVLRWTPEVRNGSLLRDGQRLASNGRVEAAAAKLTAFVERAPDSLEGRFRLGACCEELGSFDRAEACFRFVLDRFALLGVHEPAVSLSQLHLGRVLDLQERRDDAKAAYRRVLELPNEERSHEGARAGLEAPFRPTPRQAPPSRDVLQRYVGKYGDDGGAMSVDVAITKDGLLTISRGEGPTGSLSWIEGSRFRLVENETLVLEFVGEPEITGLDASVGGTVHHLKRAR